MNELYLEFPLDCVLLKDTGNARSGVVVGGADKSTLHKDAEFESMLMAKSDYWSKNNLRLKPRKSLLPGQNKTDRDQNDFQLGFSHIFT